MIYGLSHLFLMMISLNVSSGNAEPLYLRIRSDYFDQPSGLYREYWSPDKLEAQPAFNWSVGVTLSAQNAMAKLQPRTIPDLKDYLEHIRSYWNPSGPTAGFDVLPGPPYPNDRYYDDNCWMAISLVESYEITLDRQWLDLANEAVKFVLSGMDDVQGGGVYWRERDKLSKNTCSNAPLVAACLAVYRHTKAKELLRTAEQVYDWTKSHLTDPSDGLMWDNLDKSGHVEKTKWSYNSGLMISSARGLYALTQKQSYREDADRLEQRAVAKWVTNDGQVKDELQFAHLLVESLSPQSVVLPKVWKSLNSFASPELRFGKSWGMTPNATDRLQLIHQASVLRLLAIQELRASKNGVRK